MQTMPPAKTWLMFLLTFGFFGLLVTDVARECPVNCARRTEPFRQNLGRLRKVLLSLERHLDSLHEVNESEQMVLMQSAVTLLHDYLLPYLAAEEAVLHPAVERQLPGSGVQPTRLLHLEHDIMRRWIQEMEEEMNGSLPDHNAFARRGERLLGLIEAHFEVDETILYPLLDQVTPLTRRTVREEP